MVKQQIKSLLGLCLLTGCAFGSHFALTAQEPDEFRTLIGGFTVQLPANPSEFSFVNVEIAKYKFLWKVYRWKSATDVFTITVGQGVNDLESPEYTESFISDLRDQFIALRLKENGRIIESHPWSFEGHPGWQVVEEHKGNLADLRFFVIGNRFYTMNVAIRATQQALNEHEIGVLRSLHIFSQTELAEEKERLIASFAPPPFPEQPSLARLKSDAQDEDLRDNVKRVYVEEAGFIDQRLTPSYPIAREDFDQRGYLITRIEYGGYLPRTAATYGYLKNSRVYRKAERPKLLEEFPTGVNPKDIPRPLEALYKVEHKYSKTGTLEEIKISGDNGRNRELFAYKDKARQRQITFSVKSESSRNLRLQFKSLLDLDDAGDPIAETKTEYFQDVKSRYISVEKPVDVQAVVSGAIRGPSIMQPNGNPPGPSVGAVIANPNITVRTIEPVNEEIVRKANEMTYRYSYEYDSHHNWIKRTMSLVKRTNQSTTLVPIKVTYRTITYY